jgi:hypothetical protein
MNVNEWMNHCESVNANQRLAELANNTSTGLTMDERSVLRVGLLSLADGGTRYSVC